MEIKFYKLRQGSMKHLENAVAMKHLTFMKNWSSEAFNLNEKLKQWSV